MRKAIIAAVVAVAAIALTPLLATSTQLAHADPISDYCTTIWAPGGAAWGSAAYNANAAGFAIRGCEQECAQHQATMHCGETRAPATTPAHAPNPPTRAPITTPAQAPNNSPAVPAKPAVVAPPKGLEASPTAIAAAKAAPPTQVDPANPPPPPTHVDFNQRVQSVITTHTANIDVVNGLAHPRHWGYIDYDADRHPILYNPITESMTFRYFYAGDYREVYVAAGSRVVLNVTVDGVFPFTAVGDDYLTSGSFNGGSPPAPYQDVAVYVPAYSQTVQVGKVQPVAHDDSQPVGSQDTFLLDDSTLAWGQANNPADGGRITVTKTQTLPAVGPTDDGKSLIDLAAVSRPQPTHTWLPWLLGGGVLVLALGLIAWMATRRKGESI
jgi:hypothetical protein